MFVLDTKKPGQVSPPGLVFAVLVRLSSQEDWCFDFLVPDFEVIKNRHHDYFLVFGFYRYSVCQWVVHFVSPSVFGRVCPHNPPVEGLGERPA